MQSIHQIPFQPPRRSYAHPEMNKFFKALSDRTRREILCLLQERERSVGELVDNFDLSQPTISRHLAVLREARLVSDQRRGQQVIYRLEEAALSSLARRFFGEFSACRGGVA